MTNQNSSAVGLAPARDRHLGGFSLIEVTIALAIVSVTFIALLGLLPVGLNTFTHSIDTAVETQIGQAVLTQARQSKFSELNLLLTRINFYFDDQGKPVAGKKDAIYFLDPNGTGPDGPDIKVSIKDSIKVGEPGNASSASSLNDAALAVISITVRKISAPKEKSTVIGYIANNGL
jgi:prepilin-type N-terminal cleavage/methylation domain-containing protein